MAQQIINDSPANSGLGDPLKVAFDKVNGNFTELYGRTTLSVLAFGADPTGVADSTSAFIAAGATGKLIYCPSGVYKVTDSIAITGGGIIGDGGDKTYIVTTSTNSSNVFNYTGTVAGRFENFQISPSTGSYLQKPGGYAIAVGPASGEVSGMRYWQIVISALPNCINSFRASAWTMTNVTMTNFVGIGLNIDNQNNGTSGDAAIQGCLFQSPSSPTTAIGINHVSSAGIKIVDNKFNNLSVGYLLNQGNIVGASNALSDIVINGNSIEGCNVAGIQLKRQGGATSTFRNANIGDNQFYTTSVNGVGILSTDSSGFISVLNVTGNVILIESSSTNGVGISLDYITNVLVGDNTIQAYGGTTVGILCGIHNVSGRLAPNQVSGASVSVSATTGMMVTPADLQSGTANVTTSTALGSLFSGNGTATFATAFSPNVVVNLADCSVIITSQGGGGGIAAYPISVSQSQLFFGVSGVTSGGSVPVRWSVRGVI